MELMVSSVQTRARTWPDIGKNGHSFDTRENLRKKTLHFSKLKNLRKKKLFCLRYNNLIRFGLYYYYYLGVCLMSTLFFVESN